MRYRKRFLGSYLCDTRVADGLGKRKVTAGPTDPSADSEFFPHIKLCALFSPPVLSVLSVLFVINVITVIRPNPASAKILPRFIAIPHD